VKMQINLSSRTYVNRRSLYAFYATVLSLLLLLLIVNLLSVFRGRSEISNLVGRLDEIRSDVDQQKGGDGYSPAAYEKMKADVAYANDILKRDSFRWTALLDRLETLAPTGMIVQNIQPDYKTGGFNISGLVREVSVLRRFLDNMAASDDFRDVYLLKQARTEVDMGGSKKTLISFSVRIEGVF